MNDKGVYRRAPATPGLLISWHNYRHRDMLTQLAKRPVERRDILNHANMVAASWRKLLVITNYRYIYSFNQAYGRHWLSWVVPIVAPILSNPAFLTLFYTLTRDMWHMTHDRWGEVNILSKLHILALTVLEWRFVEDIFTKDESLTEGSPQKKLDGPGRPRW